jgi:two-component system KDP operon response regulator KdpE
MKILMIEDDKQTVEVIKMSLEAQDPSSIVKPAFKGFEGLETARNEYFDVVLLDLGLPDVDGIKVLQELRGFSKIPVLIISARHDPVVIANALNLGAQDYILKPFAFKTLLKCLKEVSTQDSSSDWKQKQSQFNGDIQIGQDHEVMIKGTQVKLSESEWKILNMLLDNCGRMVSVRALADSLAESGFASESSVHLIIDLLRKKIGDNPQAPKIIISEYECGYRFVKP